MAVLNLPYIERRSDIRVAAFSGREQSKTAYREYLTTRYGLYKMTLCGIRVNLSFGPSLLHAGSAEHPAEPERLRRDACTCTWRRCWSDMVGCWLRSQQPVPCSTAPFWSKASKVKMFSLASLPIVVEKWDIGASSPRLCPTTAWMCTPPVSAAVSSRICGAPLLTSTIRFG